ncbi:hypothetical protein N9L19_01410 [bacterium]|nr:hypothetical protein [bacterium]
MPAPPCGGAASRLADDGAEGLVATGGGDARPVADVPLRSLWPLATRLA